MSPFTGRSPTGRTGDRTQNKDEGQRLTGKRHDEMCILTRWGLAAKTRLIAVGLNATWISEQAAHTPGA